MTLSSMFGELQSYCIAHIGYLLLASISQRYLRLKYKWMNPVINEWMNEWMNQWIQNYFANQFYFCFEVVLGHQQDILQSAEYRLRNDLFSLSFKMVRPVLQPSDVVNVFFDVDLKALTEVVSQHRIPTFLCSFKDHSLLWWIPVMSGFIGVFSMGHGMVQVIFNRKCWSASSQKRALQLSYSCYFVPHLSKRWSSCFLFNVCI